MLSEPAVNQGASPVAQKPNTKEGGVRSCLRNPRCLAKGLLILLPFVYIWGHLLDNLRIEWNTNPQYSYGWMVPILCIGLLLRHWPSAFTPALPRTILRPRLAVLVFGLLALAYLPTRLIEAATPEWRPIQWSLGMQAVGLTLCAIYLAKGSEGLKLSAFSVCFFLVAIPWPSVAEQPIIQALTRANVAMVIELLGWFGIPAAQHGNVIEVSTGVVGVDEACSGIRSFQSSLMISLFFGEFYNLIRRWRLLLIPVGFVLAFVFNVCRTTLLTWVASDKGIDAISQYHDPAGVTILLACTAGMWGAALLMLRFQKNIRNLQATVTADGMSQPTSRPLGLRHLAPALLGWLMLCELLVLLWYRSRESQFVPGPDWTVSFPQADPTYKELPMTEKTRNLLRFDEGKQGYWKTFDGIEWQGFYFNWLPGKTAAYLAKRHTPEICLPAAGRKLRFGPELMMLDIHGLQLPVRRYVYAADRGLMHVYHCRWEAGAKAEDYAKRESGRFNQLRGVWAGRGKQGQKVLEFMASGVEDKEAAKAALIRQLQDLIKIEKPIPTTKR